VHGRPAAVYDDDLRCRPIQEDPTALGRRGVPVRFDDDLTDFSALLVQQAVLEADAYLLFQDCELQWSRMVQAVWREHDPEAMARNRRLHEASTAQPTRLVPSWAVEPASPLARLVRPGSGGDQLVVYVSADAARLT
jgi:hypothetical protein